MIFEFDKFMNEVLITIQNLKNSITRKIIINNLVKNYEIKRIILKKI